MTDKKTWPAGPKKPEPVVMQAFCVSCGANQQIIDVPANLPDTMPLQCDACVANKITLPKGYE